MTLEVRGHFINRNNKETIARNNSTQQTIKEKKTPVVRGQFRDRKKSGMTAQDNST